MTSSPPQSVDIIFAGGGTAGCAAAGRLARANPDLRILLIECGKNNYQDPLVVSPALYLSHLVPDSKTSLVSYPFRQALVNSSREVRDWGEGESVDIDTAININFTYSSTRADLPPTSTTEPPSSLPVDSSGAAPP